MTERSLLYWQIAWLLRYYAYNRLWHSVQLQQIDGN